MKKFAYLMCGIAMAGALFTSCEPKPGPDPIDPSKVLTSGVYVLGEATGFANKGTKDAYLTGMATGVNEVDKTAREGMFEKYIVLEAGKDFQFLFKTGDTLKYYGATLQTAKLPTDNVDVDGYFGNLVVDGVCQVTTTGLYHIILDLCLASQLPGGPQVVIAPVELGLAGAMNSWSFTAADEKPSVTAGATTLTYAWRNVELKTNDEFKFKTANCWKINLDTAELVKAETSLGQEMAVGAANIVVAAGGKYDIVVTYTLAKGEVKKSFAYTMTKVGDLEIKDYSNCEMELVGAAVAEQKGAVADTSSWKWGNVYPMGKPAKKDNIYTWTADSVHMVVGAFKVRTVGFSNQGDITAFDNGNDQTITTDTIYKITFVLNAETNEKTVTVEGGTPVEYVDGYFYVDAGLYFAAPNIYSWSDTKGNLYGNWPGAALATKDGDNYKIAYHAVKDAEYKVIINGKEGQTVNSDPIALTGQDVMVTVGAKPEESDKFAITVANKE